MNRLIRLAAAALLATTIAQVSAVDNSDAEIMAKCLWGECRGASSTMEKAAVAWCVLNRVDSDRYPDTIREVITQPCQFTGYKAGNPVDPELLWISRDVISRWQTGGEGRVLPEDYLYFVAGGGCNKFSKTWPVGRDTWDWSAEDIYKEEEDDGVLSESGHRSADWMGSYSSLDSAGDGGGDRDDRTGNGGSLDPQSDQKREEVEK